MLKSEVHKLMKGEEFYFAVKKILNRKKCQVMSRLFMRKWARGVVAFMDNLPSGNTIKKSPPLGEVTKTIVRQPSDSFTEVWPSVSPANCENYNILNGACLKNSVNNNNELTSEKPSTRRKVPIVCVTDVLTTQGRISKTDYMQYFGLGAPKSLNNQSQMSTRSRRKFESCLHVPFSSELGQRMAKQSHHSMPQTSILRRLDRLENYVNRAPSTKVQTPAEFPVTYSRHPSSEHSHKYKFSRRASAKTEALLKLCKPLVINVEKLDLNTFFRSKSKKLVVVVRNLPIEIKRLDKLKVVVPKREKSVVDCAMNPRVILTKMTPNFYV